MIRAALTGIGALVALLSFGIAVTFLFAFAIDRLRAWLERRHWKRSERAELARRARDFANYVDSAGMGDRPAPQPPTLLPAVGRRSVSLVFPECVDDTDELAVALTIAGKMIIDMERAS